MEHRACQSPVIVSELSRALVCSELSLLWSLLHVWRPICYQFVVTNCPTLHAAQAAPVKMVLALLVGMENSCLDHYSFFCIPPNICSHPSSSFPPPRARTLCSDSEGSLAAKPHNRTSQAKTTPRGSSCLLQPRMEWLKRPEHTFSPQDTPERRSWINTLCFCSLLALGVKLQVAKSSAKCSDCHTLHPLPIPQMRVSQRDL